MPGDVLLGEILSVGMFAVVCAVLMLGFPVAFSPRRHGARPSP